MWRWFSWLVMSQAEFILYIVISFTSGFLLRAYSEAKRRKRLDRLNT